LIEEYDISTDDLVVRRIKKKTLVGKELPWVYEIGEPPIPSRVQVFMSDSPICENPNTPQLSRRDTKEAFTFRIRNLPYQKETYKITVEDNKIVVRTTNKKYFTRIHIPDMERAKLELDQSNISYEHGASTLLIRYRKPKQILEKEDEERKERAKLETNGKPKDGDVECAQQ
jgi:protein DPCD